MRILEVIQTLDSGGAERLVVDLCNYFSKTEDVTLLLLKESNHYYLPQVSGRVKVIKANIPVGFSFTQMWKCVSIIKEINPEIVHVHSYARYNLLLANLLLRNRYSFFMTVHSDVDLHYSKGLSGLQVRLSGRLGHCKFITISETNRLQFCNHYPKFKHRMIVNGRSLPSLTEELPRVREEMNGYRIDSDTTLFIHVARFHPCKNQFLLVESFNKLIDSGVNLSLVIIGALFDSEEGQKLKRIAKNRIHFLGIKSNVYDYLACADAFCLSSDYEGMPMSMIEAMLSGLPIISTPVCGAYDAIINGKNGLISKSHSQIDFTNTILTFLNNKTTFMDFAMRYKNTCPYTIDSCANEYLKWFSENCINQAG